MMTCLLPYSRLESLRSFRSNERWCYDSFGMWLQEDNLRMVLSQSYDSRITYKRFHTALFPGSVILVLLCSPNSSSAAQRPVCLYRDRRDNPHNIKEPQRHLFSNHRDWCTGNADREGESQYAMMKGKCRFLGRSIVSCYCEVRHTFDSYIDGHRYHDTKGATIDIKRHIR